MFSHSPLQIQNEIIVKSLLVFHHVKLKCNGLQGKSFSLIGIPLDCLRLLISICMVDIRIVIICAHYLVRGVPHSSVHFILINGTCTKCTWWEIKLTVISFIAKSVLQIYIFLINFQICFHLNLSNKIIIFFIYLRKFSNNLLIYIESISD